jgi:hypothetical protein
MKLKFRVVFKLILNRIIPPTVIFLLLTFLLLNIVFSQNIHPLYSGVVNDDRAATVDFLKKIKTLPEFEKELENYEESYGAVIAQEVFQEENEREVKIKTLEQLLQKNPKARDVLYALYQLNKIEGRNGIANKYFERAKEVDPAIQK